MFGYDCKKRFNFIVDWYPTALSIRKTKGEGTGDLPIHGAFKTIKYLYEGGCPEACEEYLAMFNASAFFKMFLAASMKHYPQRLGFLFAKDENDVTAFDLAVDLLGVESALCTVRECIPQDDEYPILHKVLKHKPEHLNMFVWSYPDSIFQRTAKGRLLLHTALANGLKLSGGLMLMINSPEDSILRRDPITGLFPFMMAARGHDVDLTTVYYLIRRKPSLLIDAKDKG